MQSFSEKAVLRLCEAAVSLGVTPKKYLGKGSYNEVWEVHRQGRNPMVLRLSRNPMRIQDMEEERDLYKTMHRLQIGMPLLKAKVFQSSPTRGYLVVLTEKGLGTLSDYLKEKIDVQTTVTNMAKSAIDAIYHSTSTDYFCGDVKPQNMLVTGTKVYMADFDPTFCEKDKWIERFCQDRQIPTADCTLDPRSLDTLRDLLGRVLVFQLYMTVRLIRNSGRAVHFERALYLHGIENKKKVARTEIRIGTHSVSAEDVMKYLLEDYRKYSTEFLNRYTGVQRVTQSKLFRDSLSNFWALQGLSPRHAPLVLTINSDTDSNVHSETETSKKSRSSSSSNVHGVPHPIHWKRRRAK